MLTLEPEIIEIEKGENDKLTQTSLEKLKRAFAKLKIGKRHQVHIYADAGTAQGTHYRYYFGFLIPFLIRKLKIVVLDHKGQKLRPATPDELHWSHKKRYNGASFIEPITGDLIIIPQSTKGMTTNWFIKTYEDKIIGDYMTTYPDAFDDEWESRDEWTKRMIDKHHGVMPED